MMDNRVEIDFENKKYMYTVEYNEIDKRIKITLYELKEGKIGYLENFLEYLSCSRHFVSKEKIKRIVIRNIKQKLRKEKREQELLQKALQ